MMEELGSLKTETEEARIKGAVQGEVQERIEALENWFKEQM